MRLNTLRPGVVIKPSGRQAFQLGQGRFRAQSSPKQSTLGYWDAPRRVQDYANGELVEGGGTQGQEMVRKAAECAWEREGQAEKC